MCLFLCVCIKTQEEMEVTGREGKQDDLSSSPSVFLRATEADLPSASSPHPIRVPYQLWV